MLGRALETVTFPLHLLCQVLQNLSLSFAFGLAPPSKILSISFVFCCVIDLYILSIFFAFCFVCPPNPFLAYHFMRALFGVWLTFLSMSFVGHLVFWDETLPGCPEIIGN